MEVALPPSRLPGRRSRIKSGGAKIIDRGLRRRGPTGPAPAPPTLPHLCPGPPTGAGRRLAPARCHADSGGSGPARQFAASGRTSRPGAAPGAAAQPGHGGHPHPALAGGIGSGKKFYHSASPTSVPRESTEIAVGPGFPRPGRGPRQRPGGNAVWMGNSSCAPGAPAPGSP